jgi:hypothetical protein
MDAASTLPKEGETYRVQTSFTGIVMITWAAPTTGGREKVFPVGLEFEVDYAPPQGDGIVLATPRPYKEWEGRLVDASDLSQERYAGYSIAVTSAQLSRCCTRVD